MARYSIKMLKDENGNPFVPLVNTEGIKNNDGENLDSILSRKLETSNIKAGSNITIDEDNGNITINSTGGGGGSSTVLIDNLTTSEPNQGALDARQGKVLKDSIPQVVNNLTTVDTNKALSAYQGYLLDHKFNDYLPLNKLANNLTTSADEVGQYALDAYQGKVLSEKIDTVEDNQIISSDKSVNDIITLTKEEYKQLIDDGTISETTYYNILDDVIPASTSTPLGGIIFWPAALGQLQSNFMRLQGQTLNITDYPSLFKILGTTYGGDGETTFKLPDASGLTMVGISDSDDTFSTLGDVIGEKTHTLTINEIPSHSHSTPTTLRYDSTSTWWIGGTGGTTIAADNKATGSTGGSQAHNNLQPSLLGYWVMKVREDLYTENLISLDNEIMSLKESLSKKGLYCDVKFSTDFTMPSVGNTAINKYDDIILDKENGYNEENGEYTIPEDGEYNIEVVNFWVSTDPSHASDVATKVYVNENMEVFLIDYYYARASQHLSITRDLKRGDVIKIESTYYLYGTTNVMSISADRSYLKIRRV